MDFNGHPILAGEGGDVDFDDIIASTICVGSISVSQDKCATVEYTLPLTAPAGNGEVLIGNTNGSSSWTPLPSISNVQQERVLADDQGLENLAMTYDASPYFNNYFKVINTLSWPYYTQLRICENDKIRAFSYNNPPTSPGGDQWQEANMSGGNVAGGVTIYSHLWKDYDITNWNDIAFESVEVSVWLATNGATTNHLWNVYLELSIPSGGPDPPPVFGTQYIGSSPPVQTGIKTPNTRIQKFTFQLNPQFVCQNDNLRIVLESETESNGFTAIEYQTNIVGNIATGLRIVGKFTSSSQGTVLPEALIDHNNLLNASGLAYDHPAIDTHIVTSEASITANGSAISTLQNDRLKLDGTLAMTGALNAGANNVTNVNELHVNALGKIIFDDAVDHEINTTGGALNITSGFGPMTLTSAIGGIHLVGNSNIANNSGSVVVLSNNNSNLYIDGITTYRTPDTLAQDINMIHNTDSAYWRWRHTPVSSGSNLILLDEVGDQHIRFIRGQGVQLGTGLTPYNMPSARGANGTVLTATDAFGSVGWVAPSATSGDVVGPASSVNNRLALFNGTTGKLLKDISNITADGTLMTVNNNLSVAGTTTLALGVNSFVMPSARGNINQVLTCLDGLGGTGWTTTNAVTNLALSSVDNRLAVFNGTTGLLIKDTSNITANGTVMTVGNNLSVVGTTNLQGVTTLGTGGTNWQLPTTRGTIGQHLIINGSGVASFSTPLVGAYGEHYFKGNATATTQSPTDTYVLVAGTRVAGLNNLFTSGVNGLSYSGATTKIFKASAVLSMVAVASLNQDATLAIFKNGSPVVSSTQVTKTDNGTVYPRMCTCECLVSLASSDILSVRCKNNDGTQNILIIDMNFNVTEI